MYASSLPCRFGSRYVKWALHGRFQRPLPHVLQNICSIENAPAFSSHRFTPKRSVIISPHLCGYHEAKVRSFSLLRVRRGFRFGLLCRGHNSSPRVSSCGRDLLREPAESCAQQDIATLHWMQLANRLKDSQLDNRLKQWLCHCKCPRSTVLAPQNV